MNSICDDCYDLFSEEFDNMEWPTQEIMRGSSHTLAIHISNIVLHGEISKLKKELKKMSIDDWAGEITIQKNLKEIKDLLTTLNETVTKLKKAICGNELSVDVAEAWVDEGRFDYWGGLEEE